MEFDIEEILLWNYFGNDSGFHIHDDHVVNNTVLSVSREELMNNTKLLSNCELTAGRV